MSLVTQLTKEMKTAMKAGDKKRLSTIRMLISAIRYAQIDTAEMSGDDEIKVLQKEAKKRRESIEAYKQAGREEQMQQEQEELMIIEEYLPKMMSEVEVKAKVQALLQNNEASIKNYGEAMRLVMGELKGKADGGMISKIVKELYN